MRQLTAGGVLVAAAVLLAAAPAAAQSDYKVLATNRTSTMQKEMQEAAAAGYRFVDVMGGETSFGGNEVVVMMGRSPGAGEKRFRYRLLATSKTSTMQKELQEASDAGFEFKGQTVFKSAFGGKEVAAILERDPEVSRGEVGLPAARHQEDLDDAEGDWRGGGAGLRRGGPGRGRDVHRRQRAGHYYEEGA